MQTTPRSFSLRSTRRAVTWASVIAACSALVSVGGCQADTGTGPSDAGTGGGLFTTAGAGGRNASSGGASNGGSSVNASGGSSSATGGSSSGGSSSESGGASSNGGSNEGGSLSSSGGVGTAAGGMGSGGKACVDVEPPPDPDWPEANCKKWANETKECQEDWFKNFCDVSCGRCTPTGGMGGSTGSGGSTSQGGSNGTSGAGGGTSASGGSGAVDCSTAGLPNVTGGNGWASRYWDCCQTHCAQQTGHRCAQDGVSSTGNNQSSCNGGGAFACYDEAPKAVNDCLSYGYIAKANPNCGGCYRIQFTGEGQHDPKDPGSQAIKGKQMIVKVSNTGGDVGSNQFDLMVPGGGVGQFNACSRQWGTSDLGAQYGGFLTNCKGDHAARKECVRQNCSKIPAGPARNGCLWFVDWFQAADNPKFTSQQTNCPF